MDIDKSVITTFVQASVESAPQPAIIIHQNDKKSFEILSQFHTLIVIPFGMGKSSFADEIPNSYKTLDYSFASIIGTINQDGEIVDSALKNSAKKVLVIDEGHRIDSRAIDGILNLLASGKYNRTLGYKLKREIKEGSIAKGYLIESLKSLNGFDVYAMFSCVVFAEKVPKKFYGAFMSRFAPILIKTDLNDAFAFLRGNSKLFYNIKEKFPVFKQKQEVSCEIYQKFIDEYEKMINEKQLTFKQDTHGYVVRAAANLVKLAAHFARVQNKGKVEWCHFEETLKYALPLIRSIQMMPLTPTQLTVLELITKAGYTQEQIAAEMNISPARVSEIVAILKANRIL